jgi:hypothetical protein
MKIQVSSTAHLHAVLSSLRGMGELSLLQLPEPDQHHSTTQPTSSLEPGQLSMQKGVSWGRRDLDFSEENMLWVSSIFLSSFFFVIVISIQFIVD